MCFTALAVFAMANLTVALEYLPEDAIARGPEGAFLVAGFALYLASTLAIAWWYKPEHCRWIAFAVVRVAALAAFAAVVFLSGADPAATLATATAAAFAVVLSEWAICRNWHGQRA